MKKRNKKTLKIESVFTPLSSVFAIFVGLLLGLIIMLISNPSQAWAGFSLVLKGGFEDGLAGVGKVLYLATPIMMTGLSVGFAFKTGLFNIGASGQFIIGAFAAVFVGVKGKGIPPNLHWIVALAAAMVCGGLWGAVPGILKALFNVHEVIASIMMNYIGMSLVNLLVTKTVYDRFTNRSYPVMASANIPKWGLDKIFPFNSTNGGILIALFFVLLVHIVLNKTTFGFELKACGHNPLAGKYAGINAKRNIVLSMVIAGMLSGIGGGLDYLSGAGKFIQVVDVLAPEGYNGIPVALLGLSSPIGILFSALFIANITAGGFNLQQYRFVPEVISIITASIIYFSAFSLLFKGLLDKFVSGLKRETNINNEPDKKTEEGEKVERNVEAFKGGEGG